MNIKEFDVDIESIDDLKKTIGSLKSYLGKLQGGASKRKENNQKIFDAIQGIMATDITNAYQGLNLDERKEFYVYAHLDPSAKIAINKNARTTFAATLGLTHFPMYIGKGINTRASQLNRNDVHRKVRQRIKSTGKELIVAKIQANLTEKEALAIESKLIDIFGLKIYGGYLTNLDEGVKKEERRLLYGPHFLSLTS